MPFYSLSEIEKEKKICGAGEAYLILRARAKINYHS